MSRPHPSTAYGTYAVRLVTALAILLAGLAGGTASAAPHRPAIVTAPLIVRVVDGDGRAQYPATAIACPYVGPTADCAHPVTEEVGRLGFAVLRLDRAVRYQVFAFVQNPSPAWACPGFFIGSDQLYLGAESLDGTPQELPLLARFTIAEPTAYDCVTVTVTDDSGTPLQGAGLFVDDGFGEAPTDANGHTSLSVHPGAVYQLGAFIVGTGWPCPWIQDDGAEFHFAESRSVSAEDLLLGVTIVIPKPDPSACAPPPPGTTAEIRIVDEGHEPLPQAFVGVCQYDPATPPTYPPPAVSVCNPAEWWAGSQPDGVIRIQVDADRMYDITGFLSCTDGWFLFGGGNHAQAGYEVWRISGADLLANGLDITIRGDVAGCVGS